MHITFRASNCLEPKSKPGFETVLEEKRIIVELSISSVGSYATREYSSQKPQILWPEVSTKCTAIIVMNILSSLPK